MPHAHETAPRPEHSVAMLPTRVERSRAFKAALDALKRWPAAIQRAGWLVSILLVIVTALYAETIWTLFRQWWRDPNYSHGFLVPLFSGFLVWQRRRALAAIEPGGTWLGLPVLLVGVAALLLGSLGHVMSLMGGSLLVVLAGLILFHLGWDCLRAIAFPLFFCVFMIPLPDSALDAVALPLQNLAARQATRALDVLGVPVLLQGNILHLSHASLGVSEACSGIRSLITLMAVAVGWAHVSLLGIWGMVGLVTAALPITIAANVGRVVTTALARQTLGADYTEGVAHVIGGWLAFVFAMACLAGVHTVIRSAQIRLRHQALP
jgi:exosortase